MGDSLSYLDNLLLGNDSCVSHKYFCTEFAKVIQNSPVYGSLVTFLGHSMPSSVSDTSITFLVATARKNCH